MVYCMNEWLRTHVRISLYTSSVFRSPLPLADDNSQHIQYVVYTNLKYPHLFTRQAVKPLIS